MSGEDLARARIRRERASRTGSERLRCYQDAPDGDLLAWSAGGDKRAFDAIVTRHGPFALRVAARLVPDRCLAEDLAQEAFVRAWAQAGRFDPRRAQFTTWLYRIVTNLCIDQSRRMRLTSLPERFDAIDPSIGAEEMMEIDERQLVLVMALEALPARQRAAMTLVYDEGLSGAQAARILGLTPKAVERLLARARAHLRERLKPTGSAKGG
jgi:RNA polymerase sigma-70 factor (ECF subfamily)